MDMDMGEREGGRERKNERALREVLYFMQSTTLK